MTGRCGIACISLLRHMMTDDNAYNFVVGFERDINKLVRLPTMRLLARLVLNWYAIRHVRIYIYRLIAQTVVETTLKVVVDENMYATFSLTRDPNTLRLFTTAIFLIIVFGSHYDGLTQKHVGFSRTMLIMFLLAELITPYD